VSKADGLKEEIATKREVFKALIVMIIGILTGIITVIYNILVGNIPIEMLALVFIGIGFLIILAYGLKMIYAHLKKLTKELTDV
jgi:phage-related minor tail protein